MARRTQVSSLDVPDNPEDLDSPEEIEAGPLTIKMAEEKSNKKGMITYKNMIYQNILNMLSLL